MERIMLPVPGDFMPKMGNRQNDTFGAYGLLDIRQNSNKNNPQKPYDFQGFRLGGANVLWSWMSESNRPPHHYE